jgi:hypothetical protein
MSKVLSNGWLRIQNEKLELALPIDCTTAENMCIQYLVCALDRRKRPFKIYNLGAGVKRITTDTESCPCCKKKL